MKKRELEDRIGELRVQEPVSGIVLVDEEQIRPWRDLINYLSEKYQADRTQILLGTSITPPDDPKCLVYVSIGFESIAISFRRKLRLDGDWINPLKV